MNWIVASILMFLSSVILYLLVRKSTLLKTPQQLNNLAMFSIPVVVYTALALGSKTNMTLTMFQYMFIVIQGILFSYFGNVFSLKSIEYAPNPGYSLIISKSYVVFTAIASIFLFNSPLPIKSIVAIGCIIVFSMFIMIDKKKQNVKSNKLWLPYTLGAFFCWGCLALSTKYLLNIGVPLLARLIYSMFVVTVFIIGEIKLKKVNITSLSKEMVVVLYMIGIFSTSFNYYMQVAINVAPNVGFVNAANAASISLLSLMSALIFKDELTLKKVIGILGVTAGLILLFV